MTTSQSPLRFPARPRQSAATESVDTINHLRSAAQFLEDLIPGAETEREKKLCREIVQRYRAAARNLARRAWCEDEGQDIAEYAVMLAAILVIVIGTIRLVGSSQQRILCRG
jgi:Flp pilus assembly pilin Flp